MNNELSLSAQPLVRATLAAATTRAAPVILENSRLIG
jgi:hypothetical protein